MCTQNKGKVLPLRITFRFSLSHLGNMQIYSAAVALDLVVEFFYVKCYGQQVEFCLHFYLASQEKTTKTHVLFQNAKGPFDLDGAIDP